MTPPVVRALFLAVSAALAVACAGSDGASVEPTSSTGERRPGGDDLVSADEDPSEPDTRAPTSRDAGSAPATRRTICLTGAIDHASASNAGFRALCESPLVKGRIDDCRAGACKSTFGTFPSNVATAVWEVVFAALDGDKNGNLDASDPPVELDVIGFSWGGVNAVGLARLAYEDPRVAPGWKIARLVLLDAFQPGAELSVPPNVGKTFSFRHSVAPRTDCSRSAVLGPYLGIAPRCPKNQACSDHDFSKSPDDVFGGMLGSAVGHCDVPAAAKQSIAQILSDQPLTAAPQQIPVVP